MKLMLRSTGVDMEEDWAVDLAVSKLYEGEGEEVEGRRVEEQEREADGKGLEGQIKDMLNKKLREITEKQKS